MRRAIKVGVLSDAVPGHINQARGLLRWIQTRHEVESSEIQVAIRFKAIARRIMPYLLGKEVRGAEICRKFHRWGGALPKELDLILSAGGNTSFANAAHARINGVQNIFLGSLRRLKYQCFTAHLTLEPTGHPNNIVMDLVPNLIDATAATRSGVELRRDLNLSQPVWTFICGGDGAGFHYREDDWKRMGSLLNQIAVQEKIRWLITTSRRTGVQGERILKKSMDPGIVADAVWWCQKPRKVMSAYLGAAERVFVTADSMSMIQECISSERPVHVIMIPGAVPNDRFRNALLKFERNGFCRIMSNQEKLDSSSFKGPDIPGIQNRLLDELESVLGWKS